MEPIEGNERAATEENAPGVLWLALRVIDEPLAVFRSLANQPHVLVPLGLVVLVLSGLLIISLRQMRFAEGELSKMETRRQQRRKSAKP